MLRRLEEYLLDTMYACQKYPWGLQRPTVVRGHFNGDQNGHYQQVFFNELLQHGFKRTIFQMIFPKQTAGLIRREQDDVEIHIRFYSDGVIAAETEHSRYCISHWRGEREASTEVLDDLLNMELAHLPSPIKEGIQRQFSLRDYDCLREEDGQAANWSLTKLLKHALLVGVTRY